MMDREKIAGISVSRETVQRLEIYQNLIRKWTAHINLVSRKSLDELETRHIADSAQIFQIARPQSGKWVDLGSGGGLPGIVIAILSAEHARDLQVTLVEADQRKAEFLRTVSRETSVAFTVIAERIETVPAMKADYLSARALAGLPDLLTHADRHLSRFGKAYFPKGAQHRTERTLAEQQWAFTCKAHKSLTDPQAVIYEIDEVRRV
ncbi:MAG: 16S rRNA (guanine(527)-N(7))-methyltransferase RsmG [Qingshengfaniella sp.]